MEKEALEKEALEKEAFDEEILKKENKESLFVNKYQPLFLDDFGIDNELSQMLKSFITLDSTYPEYPRA